MTEIKLKSYAKINLALDVTGIREDGYHCVDTVMQQVSLTDQISLSWNEKEAKSEENTFRITVSTNKPYLPTDERNLAYRAAVLIASRTEELRGWSPKGRLHIHLEKRIPVAAGLGGGSGNCAAVLVGLNQLWKTNFTTKQLCTMAEGLGADVPFCVLVQNTHYRCALGTGRGEKLKPIKKGIKNYVVLAKPAFGVSTKEVFQGIDHCRIYSHPNIEELVKDIEVGQTAKTYAEMINVLEAYTLSRYPAVKELKEKIEHTSDVKKVLMSGSGPTVIGFYDTYGAAKKACLMIRKQGYEAYWADTFAI